MTSKFEKKLIVYPGVWSDRAMRLAEVFMDQYGDRMGIREGVNYTYADTPPTSYYVYQTETAIVVRIL